MNKTSVIYKLLVDQAKNKINCICSLSVFQVINFVVVTNVKFIDSKIHISLIQQCLLRHLFFMLSKRPIYKNLTRWSARYGKMSASELPLIGFFSANNLGTPDFMVKVYRSEKYRNKISNRMSYTTFYCLRKCGKWKKFDENDLIPSWNLG